jgi:hypothetical protein
MQGARSIGAKLYSAYSDPVSFSDVDFLLRYSVTASIAVNALSSTHRARESTENIPTTCAMRTFVDAGATLPLPYGPTLLGTRACGPVKQSSMRPMHVQVIAHS